MPLDTTTSDGLTIPADEPRIALLIEAAESVANNWTSSLNAAATIAANTLNCTWPNQSDDGLKHDAKDGSKRAFPFDGASDVRLRLADFIVQLKKATLCESVRRAASKVEPMDSTDASTAGQAATLLKWVLQNQLGASWPAAVELVSQWMLADHPAVAFVGVYWNEQIKIVEESIDLETLAAKLAELNPGMFDNINSYMMFLIDPAAEPLVAELLEPIFASLQPKTVRRIIKDIRENEIATFPAPDATLGIPRVCPHRLNDDLFIRGTTPTDIQEADEIIIREWLSAPQLRARAFSHGYSAKFIEACLGDEKDKDTKGTRGQSFLPETDKENLDTAYWQTRDIEERAHQVEILTAYFRATNDDGVPGIYVCPFSYHAKAAAHDCKLLPYAHGKYPIHAIPRERLTKRLLDSRGIPYLAATDQAYLKRFRDLFSDFSTLDTLPPWQISSLHTGVVSLRPFAKNVMNRIDQDVKPMKVVGEVPQIMPQVVRAVETTVDRFFAVPNGDVPEVINSILDQHMVNSFLDNISEVLRMILQLCQQYMPDATVALATGTAASEQPRSKKDIAGQFNISLSQSVSEFSPEFYIKILSAVSQFIVPMAQGDIDTTALINHFMRGLDPNMARAVMRDRTEADARETEDELQALSMAANAIEAPIRESGQNNALRLQVLQNERARNPELAARIAASPTATAIVAKREQAHQFRIQQLQNAQIGKIGVRPAMDELASSPPSVPSV